MVNRFLSRVAGQTLRKKALPGRVSLLKEAVTNPVGVAKTLRQVDKLSVARGMQKTGRGRWGQAGLGVKKVARTDAAKDLVVNSGGLAGSVAGGAIAGPLGALAGDNLGAVGTRKLVNKAYARVRAGRKVPGAPRSQVAARSRRTEKALTRLDKRKGAQLADQIGWGVGNGVAIAASGVPLPLKGGLVAMRTVPQATRNAQAVMRGQKGVGAALKDTAKEIARDNNLSKAIKRGNARERLMRQRLNKVIRTGKFSRRWRVVTFTYGYPTYQASSSRVGRPLGQRRWRSRQPAVA